MRSVSISAKAAQLMGLDDPCRVPDVDRVWRKRDVVLTGPDTGLTYIANELADRADPQDGFGHNAEERRVCYHAAQRILEVVRA